MEKYSGDHMGKLTKLLKFTGGEPRQLLKHLSDFSSLAPDEIALVNDRIFSNYAVEEHAQRKYDKKRKHGSFATKGRELLKCFIFEEKHEFDDCNLQSDS